MLAEMWSAAKCRDECRFHAKQLRRFWRVIDDREWWMIVDLFESRVDDANSINYLLLVLEDNSNYEKFTRDPRFYTAGLSVCRKHLEDRKEDVQLADELAADNDRRSTERGGDFKDAVAAIFKSLYDQAPEHLRSRLLRRCAE
jgi:hypothetical protein